MNKRAPHSLITRSLAVMIKKCCLNLKKRKFVKMNTTTKQTKFTNVLHQIKFTASYIT